MNDIFKEYGAQTSIVQAIEELAVVFMTLGKNPPKRIVLDKDAYLAYQYEIMNKKYVASAAGAFDEPKCVLSTSAGRIDIVCEE